MSSLPSWIRRMLPKLGISIVVGAVLAAIVARSGVPLVPTKAAFRHLAPWAIPAYVVFLLGVHWFRAVRWRHLIAPVKRLSIRDVVVLNWIGFFAIFALPLRLGEAVRPALSKIRHGVPLSAGIGTIAVERIVDGLLTSLCVAYALYGIPMRETSNPIARHLPAYGNLALIVFGTAFVGLFVFLWQYELAIRLVDRLVGAVSPRLATTIGEKVRSTIDGVRSIADVRLALPFLAESAAYWMLNAFSMWLLAVGCGLPIGFGHAVAIMGILAIGILLPAGPGLFGPFQLAIATGLSCFLPESTVAEQGGLFIFVLYSTQAIFLAIAGIVPLYTEHIRIGDVLATEPTPAVDVR